jgi:hypothetical protein
MLQTLSVKVAGAGFARIMPELNGSLTGVYIPELIKIFGNCRPFGYSVDGARIAYKQPKLLKI